MEIVRERLEREFDLSLIATAPSVAYLAFLTDGTELRVDNPTELPEPSRIDHIDEPMLAATILTPSEYTGHGHGAVPEPAGRDDHAWSTSRPSGSSSSTGSRWPRWSSTSSTQLKSRTKGYASLDYEPDGYATAQPGAGRHPDQPRAGRRLLDHRPPVQRPTYGRRMTEKLRELIPRQLFDVPIQAAVGGRVVARETVKAKRKDVLAKCYGGDITRKRKLLEKQKEGKKRMKNIGRVEVPQEAFISALRLGDDWPERDRPATEAGPCSRPGTR